MKRPISSTVVRLIKPTTAIAGLCAFLCCAGMSNAQAQLKVGIVDMNRIFAGYYKTKDASAKIQEAQGVAKKELDERLESYKSMINDVNDLNKKLENSALSASAKTEMGKKRDDKIVQVRDLEREIQEFKGSREKDLQGQSVRMRNQFVEEIMKLVNEKVKRDNYDIVFDKSGQSASGVAVVLYSADKMDFSDDIISSLNKTRPAPAATGPVATPAPVASPKH